MKKIVEYRLVTESNPLKFQDLVNKYIEIGWEPYGSPTHVVYVPGTVSVIEEYGQAMVWRDFIKAVRSG